MTTPFIFGVFAAERGGDAHGGGLALRGMAGEHAGRAVGKAEAGDAEARNAGEVAGLALIDGGIFLGAVDEGQFFFERHLAEQLVDAGVAGDDGNGLREREGRAKCGCGERGSDADEVFLLLLRFTICPLSGLAQRAAAAIGEARSRANKRLR